MQHYVGPSDPSDSISPQRHRPRGRPTTSPKALGDSAPPEIRCHDLRHTHATLLLSDGEPVKTVSERLGHGSVTVTLTVYGHVMPGDQKRAAVRFAALIGEA